MAPPSGRLLCLLLAPPSGRLLIRALAPPSGRLPLIHRWVPPSGHLSSDGKWAPPSGRLSRSLWTGATEWSPSLATVGATEWSPALYGLASPSDGRTLEDRGWAHNLCGPGGDGQIPNTPTLVI